MYKITILFTQIILSLILISRKKLKSYDDNLKKYL